jgi:hypothetical protein
MRKIPMLRLLIALSVLAAPAAAQAAGAQWRVRFDRAGVADSSIEVATMPPGWHVTTVTGALLHDPNVRAAGSYRVEYEAFLFPGTATSGHGLVVGGRALEGAAASYVAFLANREGRFAVEHRAGTATHVLVPWRRDTSVAPQSGEEAMRNVLAVDVDPDSLSFLVNGALVARVARPADLGDLLGLRVGDSLNLHVTRVSVMWGGRRRR